MVFITMTILSSLIKEIIFKVKRMDMELLKWKMVQLLKLLLTMIKWMAHQKFIIHMEPLIKEIFFKEKNRVKVCSNQNMRSMKGNGKKIVKMDKENTKTYQLMNNIQGSFKKISSKAKEN